MILLELPAEILLQIAGELSAQDLTRISQTSRSFRSLASDQGLWHNLLETHLTFDARRDYKEGYAWQHGNLAVDIQSVNHSQEEATYPVLAFFPMHRSYEACKLAALSPRYLPWATEMLSTTDEDMLILACHKDRLIAHVYQEIPSQGPQHKLLLLEAERQKTWFMGLPDWPLCATFLGRHHFLVCGRFPAALIYDLRKPGQMTGIPLSSHTINCLSMDLVERKVLLCGHYKGRGSMETLTYDLDEESGDLAITVSGQNRFAGVTAIVSCAYLPSGAFLTYDNYSHIYLWSSLRNALRKIDHDGIGEEIPSDMVYKMFYSEGSLVFIDQYKHQHAFTIKPGRQPGRARTKEEGGDVVGCAGKESALAAGAATAASGEGMSSPAMDEQMRQLLFRQSNDMASLTRRVLGI